MLAYLITSVDGRSCKKVCEGWNIIKDMMDAGHKLKFRPYHSIELARESVKNEAEQLEKVAMKKHVFLGTSWIGRHSEHTR